MCDGQGGGGEGDLHAAPRSAFCRAARRRACDSWALTSTPLVPGAARRPPGSLPGPTPLVVPRDHPPIPGVSPIHCPAVLEPTEAPGLRLLRLCPQSVPSNSDTYSLLCHHPHWPSVTAAPLKTSTAAQTPLCVRGPAPWALRPVSSWGREGHLQPADRKVGAVTVLLATPAGCCSGRRTALQPLSPATAKDGKWKDSLKLEAWAGGTQDSLCPLRGPEGQEAACDRQGRSVPAPCAGCPHGRGGHSSIRPTRGCGGHLLGTT